MRDTISPEDSPQMIVTILSSSVHAELQDLIQNTSEIAAQLELKDGDVPNSGTVSQARCYHYAKQTHYLVIAARDAMNQLMKEFPNVRLP